MKTQEIVVVEKLVKRYDDFVALNQFDLEVHQGEILGLLGPNGCGKTTIINCILALLKFDRGEISVFGETLEPNSYDLKRRIGIVPQEVSLFDQLSVEENIDFFCGLYVPEKEKRTKLVKEAIAFVELEKFKEFKPKELSGGLKRRLNIACGIAHKPELIFLDEPTVAVDAQSRNFILEGVKRLNQNGATIVYTTHYLDEAEDLCDRIVIMDSGQNVAVGSMEELQKTINHEEIINVEFVEISPQIVEELKKLPDISQFDVIHNKQFRISFGKSNNNIVELIHFIEKHELSYIQIYSQLPDLNTIFLELTGKELRD